MKVSNTHTPLPYRLLGLLVALFVSLLSLTAFAAGGMSMSTAYPGVSAKPGNTLSFSLDFDNPGPAGTVSLSAESLPDGWKGYFEGNGNQINQVYLKNGENKALASFSLEVPDSAANGSYRVVLKASDTAESVPLVLNVGINEENVGGSKLSTEHDTQQGPANKSFSFATQVQNNASIKQSFDFTAKAPEGWKVSFAASGQDTGLSAVEVDAHKSQTMNITVTPPQDAQAGSYSIPITASSGNENLSAELKVNISGNYGLKVQTPNQLLSFDAIAQRKTTVKLNVVNTGNIPLENINLSTEAPSGWTVEFSDSTIDQLEAGASKELSMYVTPSKDALSGDYVFNVSAKSSEASDTETFRTTVKTQTLWGFIAVAIILVLAGIVAWIFRKYGRH